VVESTRYDCLWIALRKERHVRPARALRLGLPAIPDGMVSTSPCPGCPGTEGSSRLIESSKWIERGTGACSSTTRLGTSEAGPPSRGATHAGMPRDRDQIIRAPRHQDDGGWARTPLDVVRFRAGGIDHAEPCDSAPVAASYCRIRPPADVAVRRRTGLDTEAPRWPAIRPRRSRPPGASSVIYSCLR
jgi:hypothetical protein